MRRHRRSIWSSSRLSMLISTVSGIIFLFVTVLAVSGFAFFFVSDFRLLRIISLLPLFTGAFSAGFIFGKYRRHKGMISGIICGLILYAVLSAAGILLSGSPSHFSKLLLLVSAGAIGGITGVNSKRPKKLRD
ncbi:MAG: TIGR04086 family membrane protein [Ruminococcus sp.]|nr:TIGR04086 family membrane protein [Ruminococcus sp.]